MSMLTGTRLWRPSAVSLVLALLVAILAPLAMQPEPARADICDAPLVGTLCDGAESAAGAAGDAVNGVVDAGKAVVKGVKTATTWVGDNAGNVLKAALAIGLPLATWVACSKVTKVLAAAGAGAAGGAGSAGAGAAPAAIAGAAGAHAMCQLLRKGGKVLLKVGKKAAKKGGKLANVAKLAAGAVGLAAIVYGVDHAAAWVLQNLLDLDAASAPNLDAGWLTDLRAGLNGMAGVLLLLATIIGMTLAGVLGRVSDVGRIFSSMVSVALIIGVVGSLLLAGLRVSDEVTSGTLNSAWGQKALGNWKDLGDSYADATPKKDSDEPAAGSEAAAGEDTEEGSTSSTGTPPADEKGPWPIRLLIAFCTALFGALVWLEMQIRDALLYLLLAFGGLLLAGYPLPATRKIAQRFGMTLLGVVVAKPVIVITLLMGGAMMQSAAAGGTDGGTVVPMLQGAGLMALAALMGSAILAWFNMHGASAMTGLGNRMISGAAGGLGGSRSGGSSGANGPSGSGPGGDGGDGDGPDRPDPTGDLARSVGDRVDAGGAEAGGAAAGAAGGATSSRLHAAQAREANGPADPASGPGANPDVGGGHAGAAGPSTADAPTQQMPGVGGADGDGGQSAGGDVAAPETSDHARGAVPAQTGGGARSGAVVGAGSAASSAAAAAADAAAHGAGGPGGAQPGGDQDAQAPADLADATGSAGTRAAATAPGTDHAAPPVAAGAPGPAPDGPTSSSASFGRPVDDHAPVHDAPPSGATATSNAEAYAAFGAPAPEDAAAAFGEHAAQVRAALDARPEARA